MLNSRSFGFGQGGRGLIEHKDLGVLREGLGDLDKLLAAYSEAADGCARIDG
jgi:hypothetical protein